MKKGTHTAAAQRRYTGTAGRTENAQVAAYVVYAGLGKDTVFAARPELPPA